VARRSKSGIYADRISDQYSHIPILPLADLAKLPEAEEFDSGVYFLWQGSQLVYVGKSRNILDRRQRMTQVNRCHPLYTASYTAVPHDRYTALVLEKGQFAEPGLDAKLRAYERAYINAYQPLYNVDRASGLT
jgi:hypothetical protein